MSWWPSTRTHQPEARNNPRRADGRKQSDVLTVADTVLDQAACQPVNVPVQCREADLVGRFAADRNNRGLLAGCRERIGIERESLL